jgi:hypothetical protein
MPETTFSHFARFNPSDETGAKWVEDGSFFIVTQVIHGSYGC